MLFEVKSITPKWSTNRFPTIAIDTSDLITVLLYLSRLSKTTKPPKSLDGFIVSPKRLFMHQPYQDRMELSYVAPALAHDGQSYQTLSHNERHCPAKLQEDAMRAQVQ